MNFKLTYDALDSAPANSDWQNGIEAIEKVVKKISKISKIIVVW